MVKRRESNETKEATTRSMVVVVTVAAIHDYVLPLLTLKRDKRSRDGFPPSIFFIFIVSMSRAYTLATIQAVY